MGTNFIQWQTSSRNGTTQILNLQSTIASAASVSATNQFGSETWQVRLFADTACNYAIGDGTQTASTASPYLPATWVEYVTCSPGQSIAAIRASTDGLNTATTTGTLWVTEMC